MEEKICKLVRISKEIAENGCHIKKDDPFYAAAFDNILNLIPILNRTIQDIQSFYEDGGHP